MFNKSYFFTQVNTLHNIANEVEADPNLDFEENRMYNKYVLNGEHRPESFNEELETRLRASNVERSIVELYIREMYVHDRRWGNQFYFPAAADLFDIMRKEVDD